MNCTSERLVTRESQRGFTLIELLVSLVIFTMVMLAVYSLFDQGQWYYLHSSRRANVQEIARMALEQMERDIRMSGFGIPRAQVTGGTDTWLPKIFFLGQGKIYFRADLDNRHTWVRQDITAGDTTLSVENPDLVCPSPGVTQIVLADDLKVWQPLLCNNVDTAANTIDVTPAAMACLSEECEIFTPEHIFYRLTGDADANGICDTIAPGDDPFCSIERAVVEGNDPVNNSLDTNLTWETLATNIVAFQIQGGGLMRITLTVRDRSLEGPRKYQDVILTTDILVRDDAY